MQAMTKEHSGFVPTFSAFPDGYAVPEQMRDSWKLSRRRAKNSSPLKSFFFSTDSEKTLFEAEPPGRFLKEKNIPPIREFRPFGTSGTFFLDCHSRNQNQ